MFFTRFIFDLVRSSEIDLKSFDTMENSSNGAHKKKEVVQAPEDETSVNDDNRLNIAEGGIELLTLKQAGKPICVLLFREFLGC